MRLSFRAALRGSALAGCMALMATVFAAPGHAQTLKLAVAAAPTSVDPHYHTFSPNESLDDHIFSTLVSMDAKSRPQPELAESWKMLDDNTWEFKLRKGVKFHNGDDFTAEDVVYTINRVPTVQNSPGSFKIYTKAIAGMEVVDPHTIRFKTNGIYPLLPIDLTQVYMISRSLGPDPLTEDFNSLKDAIGTGPFKIVSYQNGNKAELERFDGYFGKKPYWKHVTYRMIPNDGARTSALLAGDVDFIEAVPTTDVATLKKNPKIHLSEATSLRFVYLWLNRSHQDAPPGVAGPNGEALTKNPYNDLRVRRALSMAINRDAIVSRVMEGLAIPTGQFLAPGSFTYVPDLKPMKYDPAEAKKLLAEAGFPHGFRATLTGPNDRYVNDGKIIQAVGQMWSRIGVQTTVNAMTWPTYIGRANKLEFSAFLVAWGISSGEASNPLRSLIHTYDTKLGWGAVNRGRYSNPKLDDMVAAAMKIGDDHKREVALQDATRVAMNDVALIPLHIQKNVWGMKAGLTYVARADEATQAMGVWPAKK